MSNKTRKEIGNRLRDIRKARKLTQTELAELAETSWNYYARIEQGNANFSIDLLERIVKALGVKLSDVIPK